MVAFAIEAIGSESVGAQAPSAKADLSSARPTHAWKSFVRDASAPTLSGKLTALLCFATFAMIATTLIGCASTRTDSARDATQLVLVTTADWNASQGQLRRYQFDGQRWLAVGDSVEVTVGRNGSAWGRGLRETPNDSGPIKREGDGRAPAGMFGIGTAFGYAERASTALPYAAMSAADYCIDVSDSPLYNQIVDVGKADKNAVKGTTEPMRRDLHADGDQRYRQGFVIEHNPQRVAGAGSCIFAHLWKAPGEATAGCTAMNDVAMSELLAWLRPQARPVFVLLPRDEYARLWREWGLPEPRA